MTKTKRMSFVFNQDVADRLKLAASENELSMTEYLEHLINCDVINRPIEEQLDEILEILRNVQGD